MPILIFILIAIFSIVFLAKGIKIVQQAETVVIQRLGKYHRTLDVGINIIIPILDRPRPIHWRYTRKGYDNRNLTITTLTNKIDLRETVYDFPRQNVITKDNVGIEINAMIYFQVTDPVRAVYEINNLPEAIEKLTQTTLRNVIGEMELDATLVSRDMINSKLRSILDEATDKWGVKINRVELQDITPPKDIQDAMEKQMRAERDRRAAILEAEGKKQSAILAAEGERQSSIAMAEGEKEAAVLRAEGDAQARMRMAQAEANAIAAITEAVSHTKGDPSNYLIALKYIDTLSDMVSGENNKVVYLPFEATGVLSSLGGVKEMFETIGHHGKK